MQPTQPSHFEQFKELLGQAVDRLGLVLSDERYQNQATVNLMVQLAPISGNEIPLVETMKRMGLAAAAAGQIDVAVRYLEMMAGRAGLVGQRTDRRSRSAMRYLYDREVDAAYEALAGLLAFPPGRPSSDAPLHVALVVSGITDDNSGSRVACALAQGLTRRGHVVRVVTTGHVDSSRSRAAQRLQESGICVSSPAPGPHEGRIRAVISDFASKPAHAALYLTYPMDGVAKVCASVGLAPAQLFLNTSYEQFCGRFDAILETVSESQIPCSVNPGIARFVGTGLIAGDAIDAAEAMPRQALGLPEGVPLFGTFGRLQKCCESGFMAASSAILRAIPGAHLLLAGPAYENEEQVLRARYEAEGVFPRVRFLGPREDDVPTLLKSVDIYLDTFPFPGAQSVLEAMWAALPVVSMRTVADPDLDPTGTGPTTAVAERFLGEQAAMAAAGDLEGYVALAIRYAIDVQARRDAGRLLEKRARSCFGFDDFIERIDEAVCEAARAHM